MFTSMALSTNPSEDLESTLIKNFSLHPPEELTFSLDVHFLVIMHLLSFLLLF